MERLRKLLGHLSLILITMMAVFWVLDQYNPLMDFLGHPIARGLQVALLLAAAGHIALEARQLIHAKK